MIIRLFTIVATLFFVFFCIIFLILFQLCMDDLAVYHGHYLGVSKYSLTNGHLIWSVGSEWKAAVLAGSQVEQPTRYILFIIT